MPLELAGLLKIPGVLGALITGAITLGLRYLQPASRVQWGTTHGFAFALKRGPPTQEDLPLLPPIRVQTKSIFLANTGRMPAEDIEVVFNYEPQHIALWPQMSYEISVNPEGRFILKLDRLSIKEHTTIEMINVDAELPHILNVRAANGITKEVPMAPNRVFPRWFHALIGFLILFGIYQVVTWVLLLVGYPHS